MSESSFPGGSRLFALTLLLSGIGVLAACESLNQKPMQCPVIPDLPPSIQGRVILSPSEMATLLVYFEEVERLCQQ
jgi:hypothetical protein